jgi:hypothetical protein
MRILIGAARRIEQRHHADRVERTIEPYPTFSRCNRQKVTLRGQIVQHLARTVK